MAILEEEVWVGLAGSNIKHFESLGYKIPRVKDSWRRLRIKKGIKILVKIEHLPKTSNVKLTKICDEENCGKHVPNQKYEAILRNRDKEDSKDRCGDCGRKRAGKTQQNNVKYENSLDYWAKENNKEYLLEEFSNENIKMPNQISYGSAEEYLWYCNIVLKKGC